MAFRSAIRASSGSRPVETAAAHSSRKWRFGVFEADARNGQLCRDGRPVRMREQSFRILIYLIEHAGEIVSRDDLRRVLWSDDTYVDFDHSLNTAVMKLREALGDSVDAPIYIETIPKRGYRFVAPVVRAEKTTPVAVTSPADQGGKAAVEVPPIEPRGVVPDGDRRRIEEGWVAVATAASLATERLTRRRRLESIGAVTSLLLIALATYFLLWEHRNAPSAEGSASVLRIVPITTAQGDAIAPAFSPDGREIAYVWDGAERRRYDIYVQLLGAELPLRLTYSKSGVVGYPAWSPDGQRIAFTRCDGQDDGVYVVPALGGAERKLTPSKCLHTLPGPLAWLADGNQMLMIDECPGSGGARTFGMVLFSLDTGEKHCLTDSASIRGAETARTFALSPDGTTIAYLGPAHERCCDIFNLPVTGGRPRQMTTEGNLGVKPYTDYGWSSLMWTPDSKSLVLISNRSTLPTLWRMRAAGGPLVRETIYPALGSISRDGRLLVYAERTSAELSAIWRANLAAAGGPVLRQSKLISSQFPEQDAQLSPDGERIVWMSARTGHDEVWSSSTAGGTATQLTHLGRYSGTPRWSPDGRWIAFDSYPSANAQIFVMNADGRNLHAISSGDHSSAVPSWSRDGKAIYFASNRLHGWQVWKHRLDNGAESQVTQRGGFDSFESFDGRTVYFSRFDQPGIWSAPSGGGGESLVTATPQVGFWGHWAVTQDGLYVLDAEAEPRPTVLFYRFATRRITPVLMLEKQPARLEPGLSASADGKSLYYTQQSRQSMIKMMEFAR